MQLPTLLPHPAAQNQIEDYNLVFDENRSLWRSLGAFQLCGNPDMCVEAVLSLLSLRLSIFFSRWSWSVTVTVNAPPTLVPFSRIRMLRCLDRDPSPNRRKGNCDVGGRSHNCGPCGYSAIAHASASCLSPSLPATALPCDGKLFFL